MQSTSKFRLVMIMCTALVLSACAAPLPPTPTPSPTPTSVPATPTDIIPPTEYFPPSWTPGPPPTDAPATVPPTATEPDPGSLGPTLPPSWTPVDAVSFTPLPIPTDVPPPSATITPAISPTPSLKDGPPTEPYTANYSPDCVTFTRGDRTDSLIRQGRSATISWTAVKGADNYQFWLQNPGGGYVFRQDTTDTQIILDQKVLVAIGMYGWEVIAIKNRDRMCPNVTGFIRVSPQAQ